MRSLPYAHTPSVDEAQLAAAAPAADTSSAANELVTFTEADLIHEALGVDSKFDRLLKSAWLRAQSKNVFRYVVHEGQLTTRVVPGEYGFIAQHNPDRGALRRKPQTITKLKQPFPHELFNFTKAHADEILFRYQLPPIDGTPQQITSVLINNSPIEFGSSLMVPALHDCLPQVLTESALFNAITLVALSGHKAFRMGFNSLGAQASVNHLHMHMYYLNFDLRVETCEARNGHELHDWPINGFLFEIDDFSFAEFRRVARNVFKLIDHCFAIELPHNLFLTRDRRGKRIKLFVWPREAEYGAKNDMQLALAFCEFSGFFICKTQHDYDTINEQICLDHIRSLDTRFDYLANHLRSLSF